MQSYIGALSADLKRSHFITSSLIKPQKLYKRFLCWLWPRFKQSSDGSFLCRALQKMEEAKAKAELEELRRKKNQSDLQDRYRIDLEREKMVKVFPHCFIGVVSHHWCKRVTKLNNKCNYDDNDKGHVFELLFSCWCADRNVKLTKKFLKNLHKQEELIQY